MGIVNSRLILIKMKLIRIKERSVLIESALEIPITIGIYSMCKILKQTFIVIKMHLACNFIIGRPLLNGINAYISTIYLSMKFSIEKGVAAIKRNQMASRRCTSICLKGKKIMLVQD